MLSRSPLPELPLLSWKDTKETLHRYFQIVGKIKMKLASHKNHWWHIVLHVSATGVTTRTINYNGLQFEIAFNFIDHHLTVSCSNGTTQVLKLKNGLSVKYFYEQLFSFLKNIGVEPRIKAVPYDLSDDIPFTEDTTHKKYDANYVNKFWQILAFTDEVFTQFSGMAYCKTSPVNIYWHHMDIAVTRFNGDRSPDMPDANLADKEAYSHEIISFGFWAGDDTVRESAFYSYTYPSPDGIEKQTILPASAQWVDSNGSPMALLYYKDLRLADNPKQMLISFMKTAYHAGASLANWDVETIE